MTARSAYAEARNGEAARLNPTGVHEAYKALQAAEAAFEDDAGSSKERNYAYIATRKSELAVAEASEALARQEQQRAQETYQSALEQQSQQGSQYAEQLTQTQQELQEGQQKLQEVKAAAAAAEQELRQMQALREEDGKLVISLSGVLFETGKADLNSLARERLDTVATALTAYPDRVVAIEGHTDAQGDEEKNRTLSQLRANAVREYLESKGIPAEQLRAEGRGEESPIASNDTPEGRANNRRVEIVLGLPGAGQEPSRQPVGGTDSDTADDPKQGMPHQQHQKQPQPQQPPQRQAPQQQAPQPPQQ